MNKNSAQQNKKDGSAKKKYPWTAKRVIALTAIIFLLALYIVTFIAALFTTPAHQTLFKACIGLTIAVPVFAWILIYAIGYFQNKSSIASFKIMNSNPEARKEMDEGIKREFGNESDKKTSGDTALNDHKNGKHS